MVERKCLPMFIPSLNEIMRCPIRLSACSHFEAHFPVQVLINHVACSQRVIASPAFLRLYLLVIDQFVDLHRVSGEHMI